MIRTVTDALASQFEDYAVRDRLHDVPPHAVYEVLADGERAVCKVARDETADLGAEAAAIDHFESTTDLPVPSVLAASDEWFVATWLDGLPGGAPRWSPDDEPYARALGAGLARLHAATAGRFDRPGRPRLGADGLALERFDDWHALARSLVAGWRAYLDGIGWAGPADEVLALLDDRPALFEDAGSPVLCHGNFLPEHVGFADRDGRPAELTAVIDFEHAIVAPAAYDWWRTAVPLFDGPVFDADPAYAAFREGYESVRPLPPGVERGREPFLLVNLVSYLVALDVQQSGIGPDERPQAEGMANRVSDLVASLRDR